LSAPPPLFWWGPDGGLRSMAKPCRRAPLVAARQTARASVLRRTRVKYACRSSSRKSLTKVNLFREYCGTFYGGTSATRGAGKKLRVTRGAKYSAQVHHIGTIRTGIGRHLPRSILGGCLCIFEENPDLIVEHVIFSIRALDIPLKAARARHAQNESAAGCGEGSIKWSRTKQSVKDQARKGLHSLRAAFCACGRLFRAFSAEAPMRIFWRKKREKIHRFYITKGKKPPKAHYR